MDAHDTLRRLLTEIRDGNLDVDKGMEQLRDFPVMDIGHTKIDLHRALRNGFPEVIYGEGKTPEQIGEIFERMGEHANVLGTRVSPEAAAHVQSICPDVLYNALARTLTCARHEIDYREGEVVIVTAGTSDLPVAEEARVTCEMLGSHARVISDVGVAGIHRLLDRLDDIRPAQVIIVVAGMEGALASVIGGLVSQPIVAVPTSVGYGASLSGFTALMGMLTSCASGVTVVNIDNGFGAACAACKITKLVASLSDGKSQA
ncbi:nickel pincer cofactor biosynthesis protein LarB [Oceanidesulfovibrio marinus]|uniref:Nickel pincer cofactor biosynthesis protein LarB n=1 Tax=Oceanidesulfovibrio marinus TaxID=370038 RepID=A0A6P1ZNA3_9BACT|nr:nickel pincer cofactor biosynthesis protein LarB [Oceanidesulfovibrio marinus]QJT08733.1 nickel pincer cofactor biosynthesis protein LarB [Oceanidesulfovibrio marinus]TVM36839.1 nickel pincer cofactor biosynthesis protein LarB [Oceanidesulfovibrio marinus]